MRELSKRNQGIIYILMAGFCFAFMTVFVRMSGDLPTMQKAFFRNAVAAVVAIAILARSEQKFHIKKSSYTSLAFRCICGTSGLICNFYAIDKINISDANMLNKLSPFFAIIASVFILKEKANMFEWCTVIVAFMGSLLIVKPSFQVEFVYAFIGLLGGLGAGVAYTFVRKLGKQGERGPVIVMCFSLFSCIVTLPFLIFIYEPMSLKQTLILLGAGVAASGGQICITTAYTKAPAKEISVFDYTQVIFAAILGNIFFGQVPDYLSILGYIIIIGSAIVKWLYGLKKDEKLTS